jgi:hypothetical protein
VSGAADSRRKELGGDEEGSDGRADIEHQLRKDEEGHQTTSAGCLVDAGPDGVDSGGYEGGVELEVAATEDVGEEDADIDAWKLALVSELGATIWEEFWDVLLRSQ